MITKADICTFGDRGRILLRSQEFICLYPHPRLREYISHYHITFPTRALMPDGFTAMPDGCSSLNMAIDASRMYADLAGPTTKPSIIGGQVNHLEMLVGIDFQPAGLFAFTGIDQSEFLDQSFPFETVNPVLHKSMAEAIEKAASVYELAASFDALLLDNMHTVSRPQVKQAFLHILETGGNTTARQLSDHVHYSERQLNRLFRQHVGLSPKSFSRLARIYHAFRLLKDPRNSLTMVSDLAGFHDLSHFTRDFRLVCGVTPQAYRGNMSGFYNNTAKF